MINRSLPVLLALMGVGAVFAEDTVPTPPVAPPAVRPAPPVRPTFTPPQRALIAFDVEVCVVDPADPASVANWAELGMLGYRVVASVPKDGKQVLYLERNFNAGNGEMRLPKAVEKDAAQGAELRARLQAIIAERAAQTGQMRPMPPAMVPAPAPAPVAPAPAPEKK